jgi:multidrug efflux pump subunit AcrA (membrane-fusion protein)
VFNILIKTSIIVLVSGASLVQAGERYTVSVRNDIGTRVAVGGTVVPFREVTLTAQIPGRVKEIAGEEGDRFTEGATLIAIDDTELLAKHREVVAQMLNAEAALRNANMQYSREFWSPNSPSGDKVPGGMGMPFMMDRILTEPMSSFWGGSEPALDRRVDLNNYSTRIDQAHSALLQAKSQIEQINAKLRDAIGKAPFNGAITDKLVEIGDTVQPGQQLLKFTDIDHLQIKVDIPARLASKLKEGETLSARIDAIKSPVSVSVARIFPTADQQRHTIPVKFDLIPEYANARPGQYAEVDIHDVSDADTDGTQKDLIAIPRSAVVRRGSLPAVYVLDAHNNEDKRELRLVRLGKEINTDYIVVLSGLAVGEIIDRNPSLGPSSL